MLQRYLGHLPFLILFLGIWGINQFTFLYGDDLRYATYLGLEPHIYDHPVTLYQIIQTQLHDYLHMNGRFIVNVFTILTVLDGIEFWRWMNPILVTVLAYALFYLVFVRFPQRKDLVLTTLTTSLFFFIHIVIFKQTLAYATGAFNYVYPMIFLFATLIYFRKQDLREPITTKWKYGLVLLCSFLAGWSQEQISAIGLLLLLVWFAKRIWLKNKVQIADWLLLISYVAGALFLFLAPGPRLRAQMPGLEAYNQLSFFSKIKKTLPEVLHFFIYQQSIFMLFVVVLSAILCYQISKKAHFLLFICVPLIPFILSIPFFSTGQIASFLTGSRLMTVVIGLFTALTIIGLNAFISWKEKNDFYLVLALGFISINLIMIFTPSTFGGRVAFPAIPFAICLIILLWSNIPFRAFHVPVVWILTICALINIIFVFREYQFNAKIHLERKQIMLQTKGQKNTVITLPLLRNKQYAGYEIHDYSWALQAYRDYYRMDPSVKILFQTK
ncbi:DUF6056 family protein [Thermoactinomyces sp. DSM 45892]|uniref:DUF6056 family protein n=1 Tax=Thermoactinomyces sp. DSM 45892 TaxID=1882753 RepID=UPI002100C6D4|nr:DUF6056 family protein [Thermoactinomyces sp. DSM 45892]